MSHFFFVKKKSEQQTVDPVNRMQARSLQKEQAPWMDSFS
jgi:hypothetical protein